MSVGLMREYGTQRCDRRTGLPAARASSARMRMNAVDAGRSRAQRPHVGQRDPGVAERGEEHRRRGDQTPRPMPSTIDWIACPVVRPTSPAGDDADPVPRPRRGRPDR